MIKKSILFLASVLTLIVFINLHSPQTITGTVGKCFPEQGYAYKAYFKYKPPNLFFDLFYKVKLHNNEDLVTIHQEGKVLKNAAHSDIREKGNGLFSLWGDTIYISTFKNQPITESTKFIYEITLEPTASNIILSVCLFCILSICLLSTFLPSRLVLTYSLLIPINKLSKTSHYSLYTAVFVVLFVFYNQFFFPNASNWELQPDSNSYLSYQYAYPWNSFRSPGYRMFIDAVDFNNLIGYGELYSPETTNKENLANTQINQAFQDVAYIQKIILSASLAFLSLALIHKLPVLLCITLPFVAIYYAPLCPPTWIIPDTLLSSIFILFAGFLMMYWALKKKIMIFMASLLAIYAFLLKPIGIVLTAIAGPILLYEFLKRIRVKKEALAYFTMGLLLALGILAFPMRLYIDGKIITLGQHTALSRGMETVAFIDETDVKYLKSEKDIKIFHKILNMRDEYHARFDSSLLNNGRENYTDFQILHRYINLYGYNIFSKVLYTDEPKDYDDAGLKNYRRAENFYSQLMPAIQKERYNLYLTSFLNSFYFAENDVHASPFIKEYPEAYKYIILIIILAIITGLQSLRSIILLFSSLHVLNILATSMGHIVIPRYTQLSEWMFFLASLISIYSLIQIVYIKLNSSIFTKK